MNRKLSKIVGALLAGGVLAGSALGVSGLAYAEGTSQASSQSGAVKRNIVLDKADNFRDLAGDGEAYKTKEGRVLNKGIIFRSNALELSEQDQKKIAGLNLKNIYDLRTPGEIKLDPDSPIPGAQWENRNLLGWDDVESVRTGFTERPEKTLAGAEEIYRLISNDQHARQEIGTLLRSIADNDGAQVFHCSGGKDRTGWVSAILLHIAGVPRDVIVQDFLLSNDYSVMSIKQSFDKTVDKKGVQAALAFAPFMGVQENWIEISFAEAEKSFGSMDEYITKGLNVSSEYQQKIKDKLLK